MYKIECLHALDTSESERPEVTAPNLFDPTVSPPVQKLAFSYCDTVSGEEDEDRRSRKRISPLYHKMGRDEKSLFFKQKDCSLQRGEGKSERDDLLQSIAGFPLFI